MDAHITLAGLEKKVAKLEQDRKDLSNLITAKRRDVRILAGIIEREQADEQASKDTPPGEE